MWFAEYEAVVGLKHRKPLPPGPGQDAAFASAEEQFSVIVTADGAGSSIVLILALSVWFQGFIV